MAEVDLVQVRKDALYEALYAMPALKARNLELEARVGDLEQAIRDWWANEFTMDGPEWADTRYRLLTLIPDLEPV